MSMKRTKRHALGTYNPGARPNSPFLSPDTISEGPWQEQGNCVGKAPELFEYQEAKSPLAKGMSFQSRIEFNKTNFELAAEICIECPVMFTCLKEADEEDRKWTVRGGEPPTRFDLELMHFNNLAKGRNKPGQDRFCQRNHFVKGGGRCQECNRQAKAESQRRRRAAAKAAADGV